MVPDSSVVSSNRTRGDRHKHTQEVPGEYEKTILCCEGDRAVEQVTLRGYGISFSGNIQNPPGCHPAQCAPGDPAWQGELDQIISTVIL